LPHSAPLTRDDFHRLTRPLVGQPVSSAWRGHGSAHFLELGELAVRDETDHLKGDATVMIEWSWRVEAARSVRFGSYSLERKMTSGVRSLRGRTVVDVSVEGRIPELVVALSGGVWVHAFTTVEGQPRWTLFFGEDDGCHVTRGRLERRTWRE
jgi:hypothetical protein